MKRKILALAVACSFTFVACNNDDDSGNGNGGGNNNPTTQQKIVGAWNGDSITTNVTANGIKIDSLSEVTSLANQTLNFYASGDAVLDSAGMVSDSIDWSVIDNSHIMFDDEEWHIETLNSTRFIFAQDTAFVDSATSINFGIEFKVHLTK